jgi:hypothetical protein
MDVEKALAELDKQVAAKAKRPGQSRLCRRSNGTSFRSIPNPGAPGLAAGRDALWDIEGGNELPLPISLGRGRDKVRIEWNWAATAYNLRKLSRAMAEKRLPRTVVCTG